MSHSPLHAGAARLSAIRGHRPRERRQETVRGNSRTVSAADRNVETLLSLLHDADMTIAALLEHGVRSPAQSLYHLQLAGYPIERVRITGHGGENAVQYRLMYLPTAAHR